MLFGYQDELIKAYKVASQLKLEDVTNSRFALSVPSGAVKYYREKGVWK